MNFFTKLKDKYLDLEFAIIQFIRNLRSKKD
jgi:hypothetical protein